MGRVCVQIRAVHSIINLSGEQVIKQETKQKEEEDGNARQMHIDTGMNAYENREIE